MLYRGQRYPNTVCIRLVVGSIKRFTSWAPQMRQLHPNLLACGDLFVYKSGNAIQICNIIMQVFWQ